MIKITKMFVRLTYSGYKKYATVKILGRSLAGTCCGTIGYILWKRRSKEILCHEKKDGSDPMPVKMEKLLLKTLTEVVTELERLEGANLFVVQKEARERSKGSSIVSVLENGKIFEKACIIVSSINGNISPEMQKHAEIDLTELKIPADGKLPYNVVHLSSAIHPRNPHCPALHFHYRYFEVSGANGKKKWWFGGGIDLTPSYLDEDDVKHFHRTLKETSDKHDMTYYEEMKKCCDEYHFLKIHNEYRGVGGIFFNTLDEKYGSPDKVFDFVKSCSSSTLPSYIPIIEKNMNKKYTKRQKEWQQMRAGRYVEFNFLYDRGIKYGLASPNSCVENILATLPPIGRWEYRDGRMPEKGSPEEKMMEVLRSPRKWV